MDNKLFVKDAVVPHKDLKSLQQIFLVAWVGKQENFWWLLPSAYGPTDGMNFEGSFCKKMKIPFCNIATLSGTSNISFTRRLPASSDHLNSVVFSAVLNNYYVNKSLEKNDNCIRGPTNAVNRKWLERFIECQVRLQFFNIFCFGWSLQEFSANDKILLCQYGKMISCMR